MNSTAADAVTVLGSDPGGKLDALRVVFGRYVREHPGSSVDLYRLDEWTTFGRVIDPGFRGAEPGDRHDEVWRYLLPLSPEELADLCSVACVAPGEERTSGVNLRFEEEMPRPAETAAAA